MSLATFITVQDLLVTQNDLLENLVSLQRRELGKRDLHHVHEVAGDEFLFLILLCRTGLANTKGFDVLRHEELFNLVQNTLLRQFMVLLFLLLVSRRMRGPHGDLGAIDLFPPPVIAPGIGGAPGMGGGGGAPVPNPGGGGGGGGGPPLNPPIPGGGGGGGGGAPPNPGMGGGGGGAAPPKPGMGGGGGGAAPPKPGIGGGGGGGPPLNPGAGGGGGGGGPLNPLGFSPVSSTSPGVFG
ncbi:hypothetical protein KC367_g212 [Hortaea werneckii]|nr:hypothetical protein KC367_g212 [Hortaea werneckii]